MRFKQLQSTFNHAFNLCSFIASVRSILAQDGVLHTI